MPRQTLHLGRCLACLSSAPGLLALRAGCSARFPRNLLLLPFLRLFPYRRVKRAARESCSTCLPRLRDTGLLTVPLPRRKVLPREDSVHGPIASHSVERCKCPGLLRVLFFLCCLGGVKEHHHVFDTLLGVCQHHLSTRVCVNKALYTRVRLELDSFSAASGGR